VRGILGKNNNRKQPPPKRIAKESNPTQKKWETQEAPAGRTDKWVPAGTSVGGGSDLFLIHS